MGRFGLRQGYGGKAENSDLGANKCLRIKKIQDRHSSLVGKRAYLVYLFRDAGILLSE